MSDEPTLSLNQQTTNRAVENFKSGLNCAESVFEALTHTRALTAPDGALAMCVGFGGGIGLTGHTCGALLAAVMAVGAAHGRPDPWSVDPEQRGREVAEKYYRRYNKLVHDFQNHTRALTCADISRPFGDWHSKERRKNCLKLIAFTTALALDNLLIPQDQAFAIPYGDNISGLK